MQGKNVVRAKSVFVSWNSAQRDIKNQICGYLNKYLSSDGNKTGLLFPDKYYIAEENNLKWTDSDFEACFDSDKDCSGDIVQACEAGVKLSTVFLVICSDQAVNSKWVRFEIDTAKGTLSRNYIVPVYLKEKLSPECLEQVQSLASGIEVNELVNIGNEGNVTLLSEKDLQIVLNEVQIALNEHIYSDYLLGQIKSLDSTVIKDYERGDSDRYDFKSLYVGRNIYEVKKNGEIKPETNYTEQMLAEQMLSEESGRSPVLVYGKAGSGKSMLINKIVYDIYENLSENTSKDSPAESPLVFKVPLKELKNKDLTGYLFGKFTSAGRYGNYSEENFKDLLSLRNRDGGISIFFDAIDEVSLSERHSVIEKINDFCGMYGNCKLFFTARSNDKGFVLEATKSLNSDVKVFHLEQFDGKQSADYIHNIFSQLKGNDNLKPDRSEEEFSAAINDINEQIKSNPFILTQLIFIYNDGGADKLPKTLSSIYEKAMKYYIGREKDTTPDEDIAEYEKILAMAVYSKFIRDNESFDTLFNEIGMSKHNAGKAYDFFKARSVIIGDSLFYQIFNDYYVAKFIFEQSVGYNEDNMRLEICKVKRITELKEGLALGKNEGKKWGDICRIFLSMVEDKCAEDVFTQVLTLIAQDENNYDLLFDISANVLTKYKLAANYALINDILQRTAGGEFNWYGWLCYYVPVYNLYAEFAQKVADYNGEKKRTAMCVLRDICFIYGALDGVEEIAGIPCRTAEELKAQCRELYAADIAAFKADMPFDMRAALNITFFLGLVFDGKRVPVTPRYKGDIAPDCVIFEGQNYPVENITNNFVAVYPREFCVLHAINRRSEVEVYRQKKHLFVDSEGLFTQCTFTEKRYIGLCFVPYKKAEIQANFTAAKAGHFTGLILLPYKQTELEYMDFAKEYLYYYSFPDNITLLKQYCFNFCRNISYLFIPDKVKTIEPDCFIYIQKLYLYLENSERWQSIEEKDNLKSALYKLKCTSLSKIGDFAFYDCKSLSLTSLPKGLKQIDDCAFEGCTSLALTSLPEGLEKIGSSAFEGCTSLTLESLPEKLEEIGYWAFKGCTSLALTSLPEGLKEIGWSAFEGCTSLALESLPKGIFRIDSSAFEGCTSLALTSLPEYLKEIDSSAFEGCTSLALESLPESLEEIGGKAFENCVSLRLTTLPKSLNYIAFDAFDGCSEDVINLVNKWRNSGQIILDLSDITEKIIYADVYTKLIALNINRVDIRDIIFSDSIVNIDIMAFYRCVSLALTSLPDGLKEIGFAAFEGCTSLALTSLPEGLVKISSWAFVNCTSLVLTSLPEGIKEIGDRAFEGCTSLALESLPKVLEKIGNSAFEGCTSLALTSLPEGLVKISSWAFVNCTSLVLTSLPEGIKEIGDRAFKGCTSLALESLPKVLEKIGFAAFEGCTSLALTSLPEGLVKISSWAFVNCTSLVLTSLPEGIKEIGDRAFEGCTSLALESLPKVLEKIGYSAFEGCTSLALTSLPEGLEEIDEFAFEGCTSLVLRSLPKGLKGIDMGTFEGCTLLALESLPKGVAKIGGFAFKDCTSLALESLPEGLKEIDDSAFSGCTSLALTSLPECLEKIGSSAFEKCTLIKISKIPENVTGIGESAFYGCTSITEIYIPRSVMYIGDNAFKNCSLKKITLPKNFEPDISCIFGDIDKDIITFI